MTQTVFDNSMTAHAWARGNAHARSHNGNLFADGSVIYSYGSHFPVAIRTESPSGALVFFVNSDTYSVSTTRHQGEVRGAIRGLGATFYLPSLGIVARELRMFGQGDKPHYGLGRVMDYLTREEMAETPLETFAAVLTLCGSKADPARVKAKADKARTERIARSNAKLRAAFLKIARYALSHPVAAFVSDSQGERAVGLCGLVRGYGDSPSAAATELARAWKHAKAEGWSVERLAKLRAREQALRARS